MSSKRSRLSYSVGVAAVLVFSPCGCSGGGGDGAGVFPDPLELTGEYQVTVDTRTNSCIFNSGSYDSPILVQEVGLTSATVDIPDLGACSPRVFTRSNDSLIHIENSTLPYIAGCGPPGGCIASVNSVTRLDFAADGSVTGSETNTLNAQSGNCSCVVLPCTFELGFAGDRCDGCFDCTSP